MSKTVCKKYSTACKVTAFILCFITIVLTIASVAAILVMANVGFYTRSEDDVREEYLMNILENRCYNVQYYYLLDSSSIEERFKYNNFLFTLTLDDNTVSVNTYNGEEALYTYSIYYSSEYLTSELRSLEYPANNIDELSGITVTGYIPKDMTQTDESSILSYWIHVGYRWKTGIFLVGFINLIASIVLFIYLLCSAGHRRGHEEIILNPLDKIPFDLHTLIVVLFNYVGISFADSTFYGVEETIIFGSLIFVLDYLLIVGYFMSIASRVKAGVLFKNTITWRVLALTWRCAKAIWQWNASLFRNLPLLWKTVIGMSALFIWSFIIELGISGGSGFAVFLWLLSWTTLSVSALIITLNLNKLKKGGEKIAAGNTDFKIKTNNMFWDFKKHAESLNRIGEGISLAVEERLKSERFRTELITNVSHDLKTPLTSIINYVDLLKKENSDNEKIQNYIDVLDRQASRLRKLTEDLVEASKASTGNISMELVSCELGELLSQTAGEYEERLKAQSLLLVCNQPDEPVCILADGKYLWRIIDNLMNNITKYAQPSTRVYLNLERKANKAVITFRNTSKYALNISSEELMERFVRGDASRHTEGSGLGLSIAKSLAELQHGVMDITVDGDLFKVMLMFDII